MKSFTTLLSLGFAASVASALPSPQGDPTPATPATPAKYRLSHNSVYDNRSMEIGRLACGGGENGLVTKGYRTLGDLPFFDNIGAAHPSSYNSLECGSCWNLTYKGNWAYIIAVDNASDEDLFVISDEANKALTRVNGRNEGIEQDIVDLDSAHEVDRACCGFNTGTQCPTALNNDG